MNVLLISAISWFIAQSSKVVYFYYLNRKINWALFMASGGMPSAHSAFITSTALQIGLKDGFNSTLFALASSVAFIIIYDSFNVRRSVGLQGKTINLMIDYYKNIDDEKEEIKKLKEVMGHTPLQVTFGVILGICVVLVSNFLGLI
ncbi:divergent PAP2 family protein [Peptoniphilaceae bacterium SGI.131]